ncbi:hypothetical protein B296_00040714 [Ensete ventricosum]|uniref:Uncharacterized protein n=1 Tax=Ensete ventricosum TaxID=4639 RepID=A0A426XMJ0_ENSVE|nr:hypothetical protein B296_00040714 [Ensete ventricosum]
MTARRWIALLKGDQGIAVVKICAELGSPVPHCRMQQFVINGDVKPSVLPVVWAYGDYLRLLGGVMLPNVSRDFIDAASSPVVIVVTHKTTSIRFIGLIDLSPRRYYNCRIAWAP